MDRLILDLRSAARSLSARPGLTALAVLTLAAGISVNTVLFSVVNAVVLKPQMTGSADPDRLVRVFTTTRSDPTGETSYADFEDLQGQTRTLDLAAEGLLPLGYREGARTSQAWALFVSTNYFAVLGASPSMGRLFDATDRAWDTVVVSQRFWNERLGGGTSIAGRTVVLNGRTFAVTGVLPKGFRGPGGIYVPDVWIPLDAAAPLHLPARLLNRQDGWLRLAGALRSGVEIAEAREEMRTLATGLAAAYPDTNEGRSASVVALGEGYPGERSAIVLGSIGALAATGMVLLIACLNVAGLLLARSVDRRREMGVRTALGATRGQLVRQLVAESLMLATLGGAAGLVVSIWSADLLSAFSLPAPIPQAIDLGVDGRAVWFSLALVIVAGFVPGLAPAWQAGGADVLRALKGAGDDGAARPSRLRNAFVVLQIAGSTVFLAAAALFVQSFVNAATADPGFDTTSTALVRLEPQLHGYDAKRARALFTALVDRVRALPGVRAAALVDFPPFTVGFPAVSRVSIDGADCAAGGCTTVATLAVGPGYFDALGIGIRLGRPIEALDAGQPVAVVNEAMVERFWPGRSPLGEYFLEGEGDARRTVQVVGVVAPTRLRTLSGEQGPFYYRPLVDGDYEAGLWLAVGGRDDSASLLAPVEGAVEALDPALPVRAAKTMRQQMELPLWAPRTAAGFLALCGGLALLLAAAGLFALTYYTVGARTREFGVRIALGATRRQVLVLVLRDGARLAAIGTALGLGGALASSRILASALYGISATDLRTYMAIAALQGLVAVAAGLAPARRATSVDPVGALRAE